MSNRRMDTDTESSDVGKAASTPAASKAETKPKARRAPRRTTKKAADPEKAASSEEKKPARSEPAEAKGRVADDAAPKESGSGQPAARTAEGDNTASDRGAAAADESTPSQGRDSGQDQDQDQGRGQGQGRDRSSRRGGDRSRGRNQNGQGGFRKKGKKGKKGRGGRSHDETPGWVQPLPPEELNQLYGEAPDPSNYASIEAMAARAVELEAGEGVPIALDHLDSLNLTELTAFVGERGIPVEGRPSRRQLVRDLFNFAREKKVPLVDRGHLDLSSDGHGFVVHGSRNYRLLPESSFLSSAFIKAYGLKRGHEVEVLVDHPDEKIRCPGVVSIKSVMGRDPSTIADITPFEDLIPFYPTERILLEIPEETPKKDVSMRVFDILTPIGFGQRGLIVAPPRTGKTILLQGIANAVATNTPSARLIVLLVDERPEEVTDFRRTTKGEVVASTFDESPESHVHAAEMVISKARRLIEIGEHVVILLDSITRLARAYNALASNSGKIMSGGLEATALQKPKRFFGAARNIEGGGSLTIMGSALVDTGSRMDEVIFEEFKGTGNMEVHLDRDLVNKRIFPSINVEQSGTRKEELLYHPEELNRIYALRRIMQGVPPSEAMEMLITRLRKSRTNAEFLMSLNR